MAKMQLINFVNKLKESGINASLTKPRSQLLLPLQQHKNTPSITSRSFTEKKHAVN